MAEEPTVTKAAHRPLRRRKQLEQDLDHVTQEMYRRNRELAETNQMLSLLRSIDTIVLESQESLKVICEQITKAVTDNTDYPLLALLTRTGSSVNELELYAWSTKVQMPPDSLGLKRVPKLNMNADVWLETGTTASKSMSLSGFEPHEMAHFLGCSEADLRALHKKLPIKSVCMVKLIARSRLVGLLVAGFYSDVNDLTAMDTQLLERLSEPIGVALDNRLLFEENRRVVLQLQHTNKRLRELDETKDDFISMASHQLRTPLTAVKGYLSLVLEGDAGAIKPQQRKLLAQSFASSQRMVYLISDLLNVSRLRTGKFVIDAAPVNLADIISDEIAQLKETAATSSLKLTYDKPHDFPLLMFDETKTRQVIMNFVDNAIYYTPAGGQIRVQLINKPTTIELRVVDNGIGVPKSEQHHLFTKFYRAGNARKTRPDGTGLGLFMAKKVIIAQGGAVIFESQEGKGSTFGFTFSKSKLAVPEGGVPTAAPKSLKPAP